MANSESLVGEVIKKNSWIGLGSFGPTVKCAFELAVDLGDRQVIYRHNYVTLVILAFLNKMWRHLLLHFVAIVCTESMLRTGTENINKNLWNFVFFDQMVSYYHE